MVTVQPRFSDPQMARRPKPTFKGAELKEPVPLVTLSIVPGHQRGIQGRNYEANTTNRAKHEKKEEFRVSAFSSLAQANRAADLGVVFVVIRTLLFVEYLVDAPLEVMKGVVGVGGLTQLFKKIPRSQFGWN